mgnify:CR=1 FL=1
MYETYFGLRERPFSIAPDPRYLYLSPRHREALAHLLYGMRERGGFVQLTGEVGTGKTTVVRALLEQLPEDVDVALVLNPHVSIREFLGVICNELGIAPLPEAQGTQPLIDALNAYLLDAYARGRHTLILIDEAQGLSKLALEQVRLLTNLETTREKLLQIILVGQPELRQMLARPELRQVAQRITTRYHLTPLTYRDTRRYIRHRLAVAGCRRKLFTAPAMLAAHRLSRGTPRLLNVICDRALLGAYADRRPLVRLGTLLRAAAEVAGREPAPRRGLRLLGGAAALLAALALGVGALWLGSRSAPAPQPAIAAVTQAPAATLQQRLAQLSPDTGTAFTQLFARWGVTYRPDAAAKPCEQAVANGLRCHYENTDLDTLLARNLPALIELGDARGGRHSVVLLGRHDDTVTLDIDGERAEYAASDVAAAYRGDSITLWRPPALLDSLMMLGSEGPSVRWLSRRLARLDQGPEDIARYDAAMAERVRTFQRLNGLKADGVVGERTLFELLAATPDPGTPTLR